ncbi:hypothetical protein SEVIR_3G364950v4 [Setaria viridis]
MHVDSILEVGPAHAGRGHPHHRLEELCQEGHRHGAPLRLCREQAHDGLDDGPLLPSGVGVRSATAALGATAMHVPHHDPVQQVLHVADEYSGHRLLLALGLGTCAVETLCSLQFVWLVLSCANVRRRSGGGNKSGVQDRRGEEARKVTCNLSVYIYTIKSKRIDANSYLEFYSRTSPRAHHALLSLPQAARPTYHVVLRGEGERRKGKGNKEPSASLQ